MSVVDLPAFGSTPSTGNLLGDALFDNDSVLNSRGSDVLSDFKPMEEVKSRTDDVEARSAEQTVLKKEQKEQVELNKSLSPLDMLKNDGNPLDNRAETSVPEERKMVRVEASDPYSSQSLSSVRRKTLKPRVAEEVSESNSDDVQKLERVLAQAQDIHEQCLSALTKLQNTNVQNERRYALYLTIAFSILAVLTVVGVYVGVNMHNKSRDNEVKYKSETFQRMVEAKQVAENEFERDKAGSRAAFEVYQCIEQGLFEESVEKFTSVRDILTHPAEIALLEQKIDDIRWKIAENAYHDGVMLFNASNYEQSRDAFLKSLQYKENTAYLPRLNYYLAMSLYQLGDYEGARRYFSQINSSDVGSDMDANTRFYRAVSAEKLGDEAEAFEQYDQFLKKYRYHRLADEAVKRRARVESARQVR